LLDGLRAVAACLVLVAHASLATNAELTRWYGGLTARMGGVAVPVFFFVSGFLLYRPFFAARWEGRPAMPVKGYLWRRVLRIIPAYWLALTVLGLALHLPGVFTGRWWVFYGFGQIYGRQTRLEGMGVAWTMCIEVTFCLALPVLSAAIARAARARPPARGWRTDVTGLLALFVASNAFRAWAEAHDPVLSTTIFGMSDVFVPGMLLAVASVVLAGPRRHLPRPLEFVARRPTACWLAAFGWLCLLNWTLDVQRILFHPASLSFLASTYDHWSGIAIATLIVLPAVFGGERRGLPRRFLSLRVVTWLGMVSYGIYLWHDDLRHWLVGRGLLRIGPQPMVTLTVATFAIAVLCAAVSWYALERPLRRWRKAFDRPY
jgi:peptidoglycan/LPS O-acetylase OafA/YrhL